MNRPFLPMMLVLAALAACAPPPPQLGPDGRPLPQVYRISAGDGNEIQFRMLDSVNALRQAAGAAPVELDSRLRAAAATHSRDMSSQNRLWLFGSDGSSPLDRMARVGYTGRYLGEVVRETYESELETLAVWMGDPVKRAIILDRRATQMGFDWYQERNGKIWWTLVMGQG
jgi:uncharacterized protein YkwD